MFGKSDRERLQIKGQYQKGKYLNLEKKLHILGTTDCQQLMWEDIKATMKTKDKEEGLDQETSLKYISNIYFFSKILFGVSMCNYCSRKSDGCGGWDCLREK